MPGQLLNDFQYRRLRGLRKRLCFLKDFFSRAHSGNLNQSHPAGKSRLWLDSQLAALNHPRTNGHVLPRRQSRNIYCHVKGESVDLAAVDTTRTHWPFLRDRRIDAYGDLTKRLADRASFPRLPQEEILERTKTSRIQNHIMTTIAIAVTEEQIGRCFPVMAQLRPHLVETEFVRRVRRQQQAGYELAFLRYQRNIKAVAGYRFSESLSRGKFIYVDDLVTAEKFRSQGFGQQLFAWLVKQAKSRGCDQLHLDSGVQRFGAHRFYLASRMNIIGYHFMMKLR